MSDGRADRIRVRKMKINGWMIWGFSALFNSVPVSLSKWKGEILGQGHVVSS